MPREEVIKMNKAIMSYSPIPTEELDLVKQLKDIKVIFDVGARDDTDYLDIWPNADFHLFEPNPLFYPILQTKTDGKTNVFVNGFGLGDKEELRGYCEPLQAFAGSGGVPENVITNLNFPIKTLGQYVTEKEIKSIDFLKIDTEGHDIKVLLGAYNWLKMIKYIQYEHWGEVNNKMIIGLLQDKFEIHDVGYRNMFCMNKELVSEEERARSSKYIEDNKLAELV